jgi:hypothetical protein
VSSDEDYQSLVIHFISNSAFGSLAGKNGCVFFGIWW